MASYGELLDSNLNLDNLTVYTFFSDYFENPRMSLIREDGDNLIYGCKVRCNLSRQKRYLIAIVPKVSRTSNDKMASLSDLYWTMFQTRTLEEDQLAPIHSYRVKDDIRNIIKVKEKGRDKFEYSCTTLSIKLSLLVGKTQMQPYGDSGTVGLALETYNCVVYLTSPAKS